MHSPKVEALALQTSGRGLFGSVAIANVVKVPWGCTGAEWPLNPPLSIPVGLVSF